MEELGKVAVGCWQVIFGPAFQADTSAVPQRRKRSPLHSHTEKHLMAAAAGALVNNRLDRILGVDRVARFIDDAEAGRIESLRKECLYADSQGGKLALPSVRVTRDDALFYVALAGELLAEVGGRLDPALWERLLVRVTAFEERNGLGELGDPEPQRV